jgi:hypothetical protein
VTFTLLGVPSEQSWSGCLSTGSSFCRVGPAIGRLILAKAPPLGLVQRQTFGGVHHVYLRKALFTRPGDNWKGRGRATSLRPSLF